MFEKVEQADVSLADAFLVQFVCDLVNDESVSNFTFAALIDGLN